MNLWIDRQRDAVLDVFRKVQIVFVNASEAKQLSGETNIFKAGKWILEHGPKYVVIKRGRLASSPWAAPRPSTSRLPCGGCRRSDRRG